MSAAINTLIAFVMAFRLCSKGLLKCRSDKWLLSSLRFHSCQWNTGVMSLQMRGHAWCVSTVTWLSCATVPTHCHSFIHWPLSFIIIFDREDKMLPYRRFKWRGAFKLFRSSARHDHAALCGLNMRTTFFSHKSIHGSRVCRTEDIDPKRIMDQRWSVAPQLNTTPLHRAPRLAVRLSAVSLAKWTWTHPKGTSLLHLRPCPIDHLNRV